MNPLRPSIVSMVGYVPGFQPPDIASWIKLNTNENPYPPSPKVKKAIVTELNNEAVLLRTYPSASSEKLRQAAAELYGFDPSWIVMANGSDEVLNNLIKRRSYKFFCDSFRFLRFRGWKKLARATFFLTPFRGFFLCLCLCLIFFFRGYGGAFLKRCT